MRGRWGEAEVETLRRMRAEGRTVAEMAAVLQRPYGSVATKIRDCGLPHKRPGRRVGPPPGVAPRGDRLPTVAELEARLAALEREAAVVRGFLAVLAGTNGRE
jgi:hypothetical protein